MVEQNTYNPYFITFLLFVVAALLIIYVFRFAGKSKKQTEFVVDSDEVESVLSETVSFYKRLNLEEQETFRSRVIYFLNTTKISAEKGAEITNKDRILVAASATIPLFHFKYWAYENLDEVLIYPDYFSERFSTEGEHRNVAGMVGTGALNHKMILSLGALRAGFEKKPQGNTAIHEFVHLIDKADGEIDGIPEYLIPKDLIDPWIHEMDKTIREIRQEQSDIRDYAAKNHAEFLAVVSEYFFKKPDLLQKDHPELYAILDSIYNKPQYPSLKT